jgi:hypothetical protein
LARFLHRPHLVPLSRDSDMDSAPLCSCSGAQKTRPLRPGGRSGYLKQ